MELSLSSFSLRIPSHYVNHHTFAPPSDSNILSADYYKILNENV